MTAVAFLEIRDSVAVGDMDMSPQTTQKEHRVKLIKANQSKGWDAKPPVYGRKPTTAELPEN
jgi:hypothetical protein